MAALDNKALHRRFVEALNNGTWREAADALYTATHVLHDPTAPLGLAAGPQGVKDYVAPYFAAFPDLQKGNKAPLWHPPSRAIRSTDQPLVVAAVAS